MNNTLIENIVTSKTAADVSKNIKDGADFDYTIAVPKFDEYTGAEKENEHFHLPVTALDQQIADAQAVLDNLTALKTILMDKEIPVIADYTVKLEPIVEPIVVGE
jgi:hypothetical protein